MHPPNSKVQVTPQIQTHFFYGFKKCDLETYSKS